jgi:predicted dehydrogenase
VCSLLSAGTERAKIEVAERSLVGKARARPEAVRQVLESIADVGLISTYRKVRGRLDALSPLGYSCAGTIVAVGEGAEEFQVGDRVACAGAGCANHAEINFVPKNLCVRLPESPRPLAFDEAAFATVGAIALHGVRQAEVRVGETVAVVGLGLVGVLTVQILKAQGCRVVGLDPEGARARLSEELGGDAATTDARAAREHVLAFSGGAGADAVIITAGTASDTPVHVAGELCRDRGRAVVVGDVGMRLPRALYYEKELELRLSRSYGPGRYDPAYEEHGHDYPLGYVRWTERRNLEAFLDLVARDAVRVGPLVSHRFAGVQAPEAYRALRESAGALGVVLQWGDAHTEPPASRPATRPVAPPRRAVEGVVRVGLIGAGHFARDVILPTLRSRRDVVLRGVVTASGLAARDVERRYGFAYAADSPAALLADAEINAVVIATQHDTHAEFTAAALRAGKHVFVEKPLALNADQLADVVRAHRDAASDGSRVLQVGFNRRYAPATAAVRRFFAECREARLVSCRVNAGYLPPAHWLHDPSTGGGRIIGEGCHFLDLVTHLVPAEPVEVSTRVLPDAGRYRQDNALITVRFADGSVGVILYLANGEKRVGKERIEVFGGGATALIDDFRRATLAREGRVHRIGRWWSRQEKGHREQFAAFLDAVAGRRAPAMTVEEAVRTTRLTFGALESLRSGRPVPVGRPDWGR